MKNLWYLFFIAIVASGCQAIKFDRHPGQALAEFPEEYRGKYTYMMKGSNDSDTVKIYISKDAYSIIGEAQTSINFLDESHVFSEYKGNHFLFVKDDNYWSGFNLKKSKNGISVIPIVSPAKGDSAKNFKYLNKYFESVKWHPTSNKIENGTFSAKMNEQNLLKYVKKSKRLRMDLNSIKQ